MRTNYLMMCCAVLFCCATHAVAQADTSAAQPRLIDAVVVVVNNDVITRQELNEKMRMTVSQLKAQGTPLPATDVLEKQMLERMISDLLQLQFATESGLRVDDAQLDLAINRIAEQNKSASLAAFRARLEKEGIDYDKYREEVRNEMIYTRLREREVESKLIISDSEVDTYLANKNRMGDTT